MPKSIDCMTGGSSASHNISPQLSASTGHHYRSRVAEVRCRFDVAFRGHEPSIAGRAEAIRDTLPAMTTATAPTVLRATAPGTILPEERESVQLWDLQGSLGGRETARIAAPGAALHLDVYPAYSEGGATAAQTDSARGTVVFVGGLSAHALMYGGFCAALAQRGWNVVGVDVRGHGRSGGRRGDFTTETLLQDLRATVDYACERFATTHVALMGSSLGGYYALVAANALDKVAAGISHWIFLPGEPVTKKDQRIKPIALALNRLVPRLRIPTKAIAEWEHVTEDPAIREAIERDPLQSWKYSIRALASGLTYKPDRPLTDLRVPHLVLLGDRDQMTPVTYTQGIYAQLQGEKEWVTIDDAGHMGGLIERREAVLDAVDDFLARRLEGVGAANSQ